MRGSWVFGAMCMSSAAVLLAVACGGKTGDAKDPTGAAASTASSGTPSAGGGAGGGGGGDTAPPTGGTTTTTQLGDAGDLQGAKLGSSSHKEIETKGESGPKTPHGGRSDEPGRKVDDIRTMVQARRDEARACYDKGLKDHPGIEGDLDVKWVIDPQGNVTDISVDQQRSAIHEESVGTCIMDVIKKMKFAPSQKGFETRAHYPFNFHPKNAPGGKPAGAGK
jgi:TonB family protein